MQTLKYVVIGAGANVLHMHRAALEMDGVDLVAMCDRNIERGRQIADEYGCAFYNDHNTMLREAQADVAVILTTHPSHMDIALDCFAAGCHVLVEKPMTVQIRDADRMIDAAAKAGVQLGVCFQRRYMPSVLAAAKLIQDGKLGDVQYVYQSVLWTRPHLYFSERSWRGTWSGEGGGVLINQAAHNLDMLCFLVGLPERVNAWTHTQLHHIETEDTAHAMFAWENGAKGFFHVSTAEAGPANTLEIRGTKGYLIFTEYDLAHYQLDADIRDYVVASTDPYIQPTGQLTVVPMSDVPGDHIALYRDFHRSVLEDKPSLVNGESARMSLELANAIIYAGHLNEEITLPLDSTTYATFLAQKQAESLHEK